MTLLNFVVVTMMVQRPSFSRLTPVPLASSRRPTDPRVARPEDGLRSVPIAEIDPGLHRDDKETAIFLAVVRPLGAGKLHLELAPSAAGAKPLPYCHSEVPHYLAGYEQLSIDELAYQQ